MAEIITEILTCDLTGKQDTSVQTITFSVDGVSYEMELAALPMNNFRRTLQKHIDKARVVVPVAKNIKSGGKGAAVKKISDSGKIREWARANGYTVGDRGRIHADIQAAYKAAMGNGPVVTAAKDETSTEQPVIVQETEQAADETPVTEDVPNETASE